MIRKRLRIAVFNRHFSSLGGGAERYSIALVEHLAKTHDVHVFAQKIDHAFPNVTYHKMPSFLTRPRWLNQLCYATATWWVTRSHFDIVHSHENTWHGLVQTVHVVPVKYNLFHGKVGLRLVLQWIKVATSPRLLAYLGLEYGRFRTKNNKVILVTSENLAHQMALSYPKTSTALRVMKPGVSSTCCATSCAKKADARTILGLPESGFGILFVGNDFKKKGLKTLISALSSLADNVWLVVVGRGSQVSDFKKQIQMENLDSRVFFLGTLSDITTAYEAADCLAHPTLEDTYAMVVLEAMSHGLPVIVSSARYCGISSALSHGVNALILENPLNSDVLSINLQRIVNDKPLSDALSQNALQFAASQQWSSVARQQESIYFEVSQAKAD